MSMVATRSPLGSLGSLTMNIQPTQKRRSARLSQDGADENEPPAKKAKGNAAHTTTVSTKEQDGDANAAGRKKRKVYSDTADDFTFSKGSRNKRAKETKQQPVRNSTSEQQSPAKPKPDSAPEPAPAAAPKNVTSETPAPKTTQKKARRKLPTTPEREAAEKKPVRRSKRLSDENPHAQPQVSPQRPGHARSHANTDRSPSPGKARPLTVEKKRKHGPNGMEEEQKIMRIQLPFQDTPVIRRNRDMRKSSGEGMNRRTSSGMRGRRASSMIDEGRGNGKQDATMSSPGPLIPRMSANSPVKAPATSPLPAVMESEATLQPSSPSNGPPAPATGSSTLEMTATTQSPFKFKFHLETQADESFHGTAVPHTEVPAPEFFKHISADLPEPRRMRCLLGWCGTRTLPAKPDAPKDNTPASSLEFQALQAARVIQEELSLQLISDGMLSDWFSRDESAPSQVPLVKKPNPRNVINAAKAEELERELERLKKERAEWDRLIESAAPPSSPTKTGTELEGHLSPMHSNLLDDSQRQILERLQAPITDSSTDPTTIQQRLHQISENLEFSVDSFAHSIHALNKTRETADRLADRALSDTATILEERAEARKGPLDGMDALRTLGKVMNPRRT